MSETFQRFWIVWNTTMKQSADYPEYEYITEPEANDAAKKYGHTFPGDRFVVMESKRMTACPTEYVWRMPTPGVRKEASKR
jgi:hypothetical protein